jgi:hypothetical protein
MEWTEIHELFVLDVAERCRSLTASDDLAAELDDGAGHKKPLRKARKKLLQVQDSILQSHSKW